MHKSEEVVGGAKDDVITKPFTWKSRKTLQLSLIALTVGLGNAWRFPILLCKNGGIAFLIPYSIVTIFLGIPLCYMELVLGQFSEKGPLAVWILCPLAKGVGIASAIFSSILLSYYNIIIGYCMYFFFSSFTSELPWAKCNSPWAGEFCVTRKNNYTVMFQCYRTYGVESCLAMNWKDSADQFWTRKVLDKRTDGTRETLGTPKWDLCLCQLLICSIIFLVLSKGIKRLEKVVLFTTVYPYIGLVVLLFVTLLNHGSGRGIYYLLMPDFTKLTTWDIWSAAVEQVFFSMSLGTGALITFGSYSPFRSPTNMDAINMNLIDYGTSLAFGIVMFNCMGAISFDLEIPVEQILEGAKPLLFGVIPESLLYLGEPTFLWSLILYSSLICVGISSSFCLLSSHLEILYGLFPAARGYTIYMSALLSTVVFLQGLVFVTTEGSFFLNSLDNFIAGPVSLVVSIYQSAAVFWIYGVTRFTDDIHFMLGFRPSTYMQASWLASPAVLVAVLVTNLLHWSSQNELLYPRVVGWGVFAALHVAVVGAAAHQALACRRKGNLALVLRPEPEWGPRDATLLKSRRMFSSQAMTKEYMYRQTRAKELSRQKSIAVI